MQIMTKIDIEALKKEGFSFEEIDSIKRGLENVENGRIVSFNNVKIKARKELFSKQKNYV